MAGISSTADPFFFNISLPNKPSIMVPPRNTPKPTPSNSGSEEPYLPLSESRLRCASKRRLYRSFRQAHKNKAVTEWLFHESNQPFHKLPVVSPSCFENALGLHVEQSIEGIYNELPSKFGSGNSSNAKGSSSSALPVEPGKDMLFVPVMQTQGKLMGYTFGGLGSDGISGHPCPFGSVTNFIFPHYVGRFVFDPALGDLLFVSHGAGKPRACGIGNIRVGERRGTRERSMFIVPRNQYSHDKLPARIFAMVTAEETRVSSLPKYQFAINVSSSGAGSSSGESRRSNENNIDELKPLLAHLERLLKGDVRSERICRDDFTFDTGEVANRRTGKLKAEFDVIDAIKMQVFKDSVIRNYYSYMASVASKKKRG